MKNDLTKAMLQRELCSRRTVTFNLAVQERSFGDQRALFASPAIATAPAVVDCDHVCSRSIQKTFAGVDALLCVRCGAEAPCVHVDGIEMRYEGDDVVFFCELEPCGATVQRRKRGTV